MGLSATPPVSASTRATVPFSGWALYLTIDLDRACPGLLAATFRFGVQRRQAFFLVLAAVQEHGIDKIGSRLRHPELAPEFRDLEDMALLGRAVVLLRRPRDLVRAVFGRSPDGLLGALARFGPDPIGEADTYIELARLFFSSDPADRRRAKVVGQIDGSLVGAHFRIVSLLDPALLHPAMVKLLRDEEQVAQIHHALAYVRAHCSRASDDAIRASLGRLRPDGRWSDLIRTWAARFDRLPCSLDTKGDPTLVVLDSADALISAGRRYRDCLGSKIFDTLLGCVLFVEYRPEAPVEPGLICELRRTTQGYVLEGLFARENRRVRADRACIVRGKLAACGVAILDHGPGDWKVLNATARALGIVNFDEPDNDRWGDEVLEVAAGLQQILDEAA
ncbi:hypothetical protein ACRAWG_35470 [Methylobacterium sp. P31]